MSVATQLTIESLARDPSGLLVASTGALRRAENVVIRAPGVAESRPNFEMLKEDVSSTQRVKSLYEFQGEVLSVDYSPTFLSWYIRRVSTLAPFEPSGGTVANIAQPVDYDAAETKFAEARGSLYFTAKAGILKIASPFITSTGLDYAGVEMLSVSDFVGANASFSDATYSWAYQFVFVRNDVNGYIRRGPPTERFVVTSQNPVPPAHATRIYFPTDRIQIGDTVEAYRSRMFTGTSPSSEVYLSWTYQITNADHSLGYFHPPIDATVDNQLGAALYTNPTQGTVIAAKYPPPQAQALAYFGSVMWYGRTVSKQRAVLTVKSIGLGGVVTAPQLCTFNGTGTVTTGSTANWKAGDSFTDNLDRGPGVAGTYVPSGTTILTIIDATTFTISSTPGTGTGYAGVMIPNAPKGIASGVGSGTHFAGSTTVSGVPDTTLLTVGMGWSDAAGGPATAGTLTSADTLIDEITSPTTIRLSKPALSSGTGAAGYDSLLLGSTRFYFIDGTTLLGAKTPVWSWPTRCIPYYGNRSGAETQYLSLTTCTAMAVNYYALTNPTFKIRGVPIGDTNLDDGAHGVIGNIIPTLLFEEVGVGGASFYVSPSRTTAFDPTPPFSSSNASKPNRLAWSDLNEPEAVRLASFLDVGSENFPISALVPLRDALLIFKAGDGVYRLTGSGPANWTIDCIDPRLRLIRPEAVAVVDQAAYCWAERGLFHVTETGVQSLSADRLDVELRPLADSIEANTDTHGAWVVAWPQRQLLLFGTPSDVSSQKTGKIYCYSLITGAFTEWPLAWDAVGNSKVDNLYYGRPDHYEIREAKAAIEGFDRAYSLTDSDVTVITALGVTTAIVPAAAVLPWVPVVGDALSRLTHDGWRQFRRITAVVPDSGTLVMTLESAYNNIDSTVVPTYVGHEMAECEIVIEWPPTAPAGIPTGAIAREIQVQFDLREAPPTEPAFDATYGRLIDDAGNYFVDEDGNYLVYVESGIPTFLTETPSGELISSIPYYEIGATPENATEPTTLVSRRVPRVAQIQPIRVGASRQVARSASLAPYVKTSDIFAIRVNGISLVFEGTSERTRK